MTLSDEINDDVDTLTPSRLFHPFGEILRLVVDGVGRAIRKGHNEIKLLLLRRCCKDRLPEIDSASGKVGPGACVRLEGLRELNSSNSNAFNTRTPIKIGEQPAYYRNERRRMTGVQNAKLIFRTRLLVLGIALTGIPLLLLRGLHPLVASLFQLQFPEGTL